MSELVEHSLSFALRVDDHFTNNPVASELAVTLDTPDVPIGNQTRTGTRFPDGTYRFIGVPAGSRIVTVTASDGTAFTWTPSTPVILPLPDRRIPVVIELWPTPSASIAVGALVVRGKLVTAAAGQIVQIEAQAYPTSPAFPPRNKRTRSDANGEFAFVVAGSMGVRPDNKVALACTVPGHTITSIDVVDGATTTTTAGSNLLVTPGRETRAIFHLV
jgi:hypothetical protein